MELAVSARVDETSLEATATRTLVDDGVTFRRIPREDLTGWLVTPGIDGPSPGVVLLHGSQGRVPGRVARMLASHGYAVLALRYFGAPGLPSTLDDVPLEYFDRAMSYLLDRDDVHDGRVGLVGVSRGVEAALLAAAAFEGQAAVVGYSGSGLVLPGLDESRGVAGYEAAWTRDGEPVAPAPPIERLLWAARTPATEASTLEDAVAELRSTEAADRVGVPVEEIDGPVVLLSGQQDGLWDGPLLSEYAVARLAEHDHPHPFGHVTYGGAGHVFIEPYLDVDPVIEPPLGGTPRGTARAAADAFVRCLDYLREGLGDGSSTST